MATTRRKTRRQQHEFWHDHVVSWSKSGLSQKEYASHFGLEYSSLCRWRRFFEREPSLLPSIPQDKRLSERTSARGRKKKLTLFAPHARKLPTQAAASIPSKPVIVPFGSFQTAAGKTAFFLNRQGRYQLEIPADFAQDALETLLDCLEAHL
jgi:hypothetical protein